MREAEEKFEREKNTVPKVGSNKNKEVKIQDYMQRHSVFEKKDTLGELNHDSVVNPNNRQFKAMSVGNMDEFVKKMKIRQDVLDGSMQ